MDIKKTIAQNPTMSKVTSKTMKAAPTVAFIAGVAGSVASLVLMWRAARKHDEVIVDVTDILDEVHELKPVEGVDPDSEENEGKLTLPAYRKELVKAYIKAGFKLGKLYAPVVVSEAASLALLGLGYGTLNNRYLSTLAACTMAEHEFAKYRQKVIDNFGDETDQRFRFGIKNKEFERPVLDDEGNPKLDKNGHPKTTKVTERVIDDGMEGYSGYARIFDKEHSKQFDGDADTGMATSWYNREFLINQQNYFNMLLKYRPSHTVFLNEVYEALGYDRTKAGQVVGWHYDLEHPSGDNVINFVPIEFFDEKYQAKRVILDFNVDGNVWGYLT